MVFFIYVLKDIYLSRFEFNFIKKINFLHSIFLFFRLFQTSTKRPSLYVVDTFYSAGFFFILLRHGGRNLKADRNNRRRHPTTNLTGHDAPPRSHAHADAIRYPVLHDTTIANSHDIMSSTAPTRTPTTAGTSVARDDCDYRDGRPLRKGIGNMAPRQRGTDFAIVVVSGGRDTRPGEGYIG